MDILMEGGATFRSLEVMGGTASGFTGHEVLLFDGADGDELSFELNGVIVRTGSSQLSGGVTLKVGAGTTTPSIAVNVIGSTFKMAYSGVTGIEASATADVDLDV